jgi:hypothetical protein
MDGKHYGRASSISDCRSRKRLHCGGRIQRRHRLMVQKSDSGCVCGHASAPVPGQHDKKRNRLLDKCWWPDRIQDLPQRNYLARMDWRNRPSGRLNNIGSKLSWPAALTSFTCQRTSLSRKMAQSGNQEKELRKSLIRLMLSPNCFDSALLLSAQSRYEPSYPAAKLF